MMILEANSDGKITVALSDGSEVEIKVNELKDEKSKIVIRYNHQKFSYKFHNN